MLINHALFLTHFSSPPYEFIADNETLEYLLTFQSASIRMQFQPAIKASNNLGLTSKVISLGSSKEKIPVHCGLTKYCLIGKLTTKNNLISQINIAKSSLKIITELRQKKIPIVIIYSDNWINSPSKEGPNSIRRQMYFELIRKADLIICPSSALANTARRATGQSGNIKIIEDPLQFSRQPFTRSDIYQECRIIWFGNQTNLKYLYRELPNILLECDQAEKFSLTIISNKQAHPEIKKFLHSISSLKTWRFKICSWNLDTLANELKNSHIAILPSDINDPIKSAVSHNRAADSLQAGCIVIANPLDSYKELNDGMILTNNFSNQINFTITNYKAIVTKFAKIRDELLHRFEPNINQNKWSSLFLDLLKKHKF